MLLIFRFLHILFGKAEEQSRLSLSDEELVSKYLEHQDEDLFLILYKRYSSKIYGKCVLMLKDFEQAQDSTQEIFIKVLLNLSRYNQSSKFSTWMYAITYNYCIDLIRKKKNSIFLDKEFDKMDLGEEVQDSFLLETKVLQLKKVLDEIQVDDKTILIMKYQDELSIKEIGEILGKSESAIKMKIKRAKYKFKSMYDTLYQ